MARKIMRRAIIPSAQDESMFQADMPELISKIYMKTNFIFYMTGGNKFFYDI